MQQEIAIERTSGIESIRSALQAILKKYAALLPDSRNAKILLKPNFNSHMNALTGNTTDLRVIAGLVETLAREGYLNITLAEGTNSGFYRNQIDVASRLRARALAQQLGVAFADLNYCEGIEIGFLNGTKAEVAKICREADLFINLPKLKMHHEVGVSACLKNMMGCLVGLENKKKTHENLARNIIELNKYLKPHLHIVDGLVAMEGNGPSAGIPVRMDVLVAGTDPFVVDMVCAQLVGMDYREVTYLKTADELGLITEAQKAAACTLDLAAFKRDLLKPSVSLPLRVISNPHLQKYFQALRQAPGIYSLCNTALMGDLLVRTGIRQEIFVEEEMDIKRIFIDSNRCKEDCRKCEEYCPLGLPVREILSQNDARCVKCLYCYMVCPNRAIQLDGAPGFVKVQIEKYDSLIRAMA